MKRFFGCLAFATVLVGSGVGAVAADADDAGWRGFLVGGVTRGGDSLFTVVTVGTGATTHVYAGNLFQIGTGALWTARSLPLAFGVSINYHVDDAGGANGSVQFKRVPIEAMGYFLSDDGDWRLGLGGRYVLRPRLESKFENGGVTSTFMGKFDDARGLVVETGWRYGKNTWLNFRAVKEAYQINAAIDDGVALDVSGVEEFNGAHIGFNILYAF